MRNRARPSRKPELLPAEKIIVTNMRYAGAHLIVLGPLVSIAFGRWGSYLKIPGLPLFFADLAVMIGIVLLLLGADERLSGVRRPHQRSQFRDSYSPASMVALGSIMSICCVILGLTFGAGLQLFTIRDAMPFVYFALVPAFVYALQIIGSARLIEWLSNALIIHTIWVFPVMIGVLNPVQIPIIGGTAAFTTRGDYDIFLCGLAIAVVICDRRIGAFFTCAIVLANVIPMVLSGSRSGAIAGLIVVLVISVLRRPFSKPVIGPVRLAATSAAAAIALPFVVIYAQKPPTWAVGIQKLLPRGSDTYESGQNTWNARVYAWGRLVNYTTDEPTRKYFGSGFGANPVRESGALQFLSGDPQVRAGHNVFVTWFSFLGVVGLIVAILALTCFAAASFAAGKPIVLMTTLGRAMMAGILLTAIVGVILESPFGYMTFTLASAMAIARPGPGPAVRGRSRPKIIEPNDVDRGLVCK